MLYRLRLLVACRHISSKSIFDSSINRTTHIGSYSRATNIALFLELWPSRSSYSFRMTALMFTRSRNSCYIKVIPCHLGNGAYPDTGAITLSIWDRQKNGKPCLYWKCTWNGFESVINGVILDMLQNSTAVDAFIIPYWKTSTLVLKQFSSAGKCCRVTASNLVFTLMFWLVYHSGWRSFVGWTRAVIGTPWKSERQWQKHNWLS